MGMAPEWLAATLNHGSIPPHEATAIPMHPEVFDEQLPAALAKNA
jgi:hypothetical protein